MNEVQVAREKYRPENIKIMFIAEAPPCTEGQFFYFENVEKGDSLFLHIIRAVFPELEKVETKKLRQQKAQLLEDFKNAGYFLEDSVFEMIPKGTKPTEKQKLIVEGQQGLLDRIAPYKENTAFIVLSSLVFKCNHQLLKNEGYTVLNDFMIPFPGSGQQGKFKEGMARLAF